MIIRVMPSARYILMETCLSTEIMLSYFKKTGDKKDRSTISSTSTDKMPRFALNAPIKALFFETLLFPITPLLLTLAS